MMTPLAGCVLATTPGAREAGIPIEAWVEVYGRLHVLLLHFPLALLIVAAGVELWRAAARQATLSSTSVVCVVIGGLSAGVVASTGWIHAPHALGEGPDDLVLALHRWLGVAAAGTGFLAGLLAVISKLMRGTSLVGVTRMLMLLAAAAVGIAGHFGGSITHGDGYVLAPLKRSAPEPVVVASTTEDEAAGAPTPTEAAEGAPEAGSEIEIRGVSFEADVQPILEQHCHRCHGETRQRGGVRLDSLDLVMLEVVPGEPEESYLLEVLLLPEDDDLHMPKNKPSLPEEDIDTIRRWIASLGAEGAVIAETPDPAEPVEIDEPEVRPEDFSAPAPAPLPELDESERAVRDEALARLREAGLMASVVAASEDAVEVRVGGGASSIGDEEVELLRGLESSLIVLDLGGTSITDAALETIRDFGHLRRLRIGETGITDEGLSHLAGLTELESLDLHMTGVTDEGLEALEGMERLRMLYLWETGVTTTGAARVQAARPWIEIDLGTP